MFPGSQPQKRELKKGQMLTLQASSRSTSVHVPRAAGSSWRVLCSSSERSAGVASDAGDRQGRSVLDRVRWEFSGGSPKLVPSSFSRSFLSLLAGKGSPRLVRSPRKTSSLARFSLPHRSALFIAASTSARSVAKSCRLLAPILMSAPPSGTRWQTKVIGNAPALLLRKVGKRGMLRVGFVSLLLHV